MTTEIRSDSIQAVLEVTRILVKEGFAEYIPNIHAGFVTSAGMVDEDDEPAYVLVNFATDQDDNEALAAIVNQAYGKALEFNSWHVDLVNDAGGAGLVCWEE